MSPRSSTSMPSTVPLLGKLTTMPPGQCASVPGLSVQPQIPTVDAPSMLTSRSVPAADVTFMRFDPRSILAAARTRVCSASSGRMRSSASGCSLEMTMMRAPAFKISGVSGACISPSKVQSTTKPDCASALTTGLSRPIASLDPVERTGTGCGLRGVGTTTWNGRAPSRSSANSARCTFSSRDCVSDRIDAVSPRLTAHFSNTSQKASIHLASMRSANILRASRAKLAWAHGTGRAPSLGPIFRWPSLAR